MSNLLDPTVPCPKCGHEIKLSQSLTESLAAPMVESARKKYQEQLAAKDADVAKRDAEFAKRESAFREQQAALAKAKESLDEQVAAKLKTERAAIAADEAKKAKLMLANEFDNKAKELADLQSVLKQRDEKLAEAQKAQADLIRKQRELDDAKREMELTIEKSVQEKLIAVRTKAKQDAEDELKLKVMEKEMTIKAMQTQIEELKRRAEQGSQQLQGEALELELETALKTKFPTDLVEPVPKGEYGGDVVHRVMGSMQQRCGSILWESKRTKTWQDGWLAKLRDDQRAAKAEFAIIVTQVLPKEIESFGQIDGVWITTQRSMIPLAIALRQSLVEVSLARQTGEGQQTKKEMIYQYLTGPRFRLRVEAIVEKIADMQQDLEKERKTMTKLWAKREEQIRSVIDSTAGMYGDLQGIAGKTLQEIEGLDMKLIEEGQQS